MLIEACCSDREILEQSILKSRWHVHSKFNHSFNIQDETSQRLAVISTEQTAAVPNGIYLKASDFEQLLSQVRVGDPLIMQNRILRIAGKQLVVSLTREYTSHYVSTGGLTAEGWKEYSFSLKKVKKPTGYQEPLSTVFDSGNDFTKAIDALCSDSLPHQRKALHFLIGRGPGLTPSGDDMLIGYLAARLILDKGDTKLETYLRTKLLSVADLTTDVSKHYLLCGLDQRFNQSILQLLKAVSEITDELEPAIQLVLQTGHTSGADFLAGFSRTLNYFRNEHREATRIAANEKGDNEKETGYEGGKKWQIG